jgi:hypothetical protein
MGDIFTPYFLILASTSPCPAMGQVVLAKGRFPKNPRSDPSHFVLLVACLPLLDTQTTPQQWPPSASLYHTEIRTFLTTLKFFQLYFKAQNMVYGYECSMCIWKKCVFCCCEVECLIKCQLDEVVWELFTSSIFLLSICWLSLLITESIEVPNYS